MQDDNQNNPGTVIQPGGAQSAESQKPASQSVPETPTPPAPTPELEANPQISEPAPSWKYQEKSTPTPVPNTTPIGPVSWTASEFIEHSKSLSWYALLAGGALILAALVFLLTKDKVSAGVVVVVALIFGIMANHKPRELTYQVGDSGIQIGEKSYPYENFKSYAVVQENAIESIWLMPLKRFMPILTIYFDPKDEKRITDVLGAYLPLEDHELDAVDKLMHKIRF